jgi:predicted nucleic acid-binding protein
VIVFVLDASAVLRFIGKEAGWERIAAILTAQMDQTAEIAISAVQWGEIAGAVRKKLGASAQDRVMRSLAQFQPRIVAATGERAVQAAAIKVDRKIAYADAFALDLAMDSPDHVLVTADYGFKAVTGLARIEFLPAK